MAAFLLSDVAFRQWHGGSLTIKHLIQRIDCFLVVPELIFCVARDCVCDRAGFSSAS